MRFPSLWEGNFRWYIHLCQHKSTIRRNKKDLRALLMLNPHTNLINLPNSCHLKRSYSFPVTEDRFEKFLETFDAIDTAGGSLTLSICRDLVCTGFIPSIFSRVDTELPSTSFNAFINKYSSVTNGSGIFLSLSSAISFVPYVNGVVPWKSSCTFPA